MFYISRVPFYQDVSGYGKSKYGHESYSVTEIQRLFNQVVTAHVTPYGEIFCIDRAGHRCCRMWRSNQ